MSHTFVLDEALHAQILETCETLELRAHPPSETIRFTPDGHVAGASSLEAHLESREGVDALRDPARDLEPVRLLGHGGMGQVNLARQRSLGREVAVKSLLPHRRGTPAGRHLLREARLLAALEHPHIVPVHVLGWDDVQGPLLVMKRIDGTSWWALIRSPRHPGWEGLDGDRLERHLDILSDVCQAVEFAHSRGILHRDIKTDNVMVGQFGEVYLVDWGVALRLEEGQAGRERLAGTPAYMAPEMVRGGPLTPRTDVYLLGACLHEVLTGAPPHASPDTPTTLARAAASEPGTYPDDTPAELARICDRACHREPAQRYESARALRTALREFLRHRSSLSTAEAAAGRLAQLTDLLGGEREPEPAVVHRLFNESRFGFTEALRQWPDNPDALHGQQAALEAMIGYALRSGDARLAAALLEELPAPRPALQADLARLEATRPAEQTAFDRLRALEADMRFQGLNPGRSLATLLNGVCTTTATVTAGWWCRSVDMDPAPLGNLLFMLGCLILLLLASYALRGPLFSTERYRRLMAAHIAFTALMVFNRALYMLWEVPFFWSLFADGATITAVVGTMAVMRFPGFRVSFAIAALGVPLALLAWPWTLEVAAALYMVNSVWLAYILLPEPSTPHTVDRRPDP